MEIYHTPVLLKEILSLMPSPAENINVIDATLGEGGHTEAFLKEGANVYATERDEEILKRAKERLSAYENVQYALCTYDKMKENAPKEFVGNTDFILMDLGVSLFHFKGCERGFSFKEESPLDMRLGLNEGKSAMDVVNDYDEEELFRVFKEYGEIRFAHRIAEAIVSARASEPLRTAKELENIVFHATPKKFRFAKTHPATRVFQAIRIEVNDELEILKRALVSAFEMLKEGGQLVVMSYHSLEDRIVKTFMRERSEKHGSKELKILNKKVIVPSKSEIKRNPAARSAKLRAALKLES